MFWLAYRQLKQDLGRSALSCLGIAAVVATILVFEGFEQGQYAQLRAVSRERGADLIATQAGVANMVAARSVIPQMVRADLEAVPGVRTAHPMTGLPLIYEGEGRRSAIFLYVYDTRGGPVEIVEGRGLGGERQIVIDRALAAVYELEPGDELVVSDFAFEVVGITEGASVLFTPMAFIRYDDLLDFYFESNLAEDISAFPLLSHALIELEPGADRERVAADIEARVPDVDVGTPHELGERDVGVGRAIIGGILGVIIAVGYAAGVLVVGLFMFSATEARTRDFGVLKAIGFSDRQLLRAVLIEAGLLTLAALPLGYLLAHVVAAAVHTAAPVYLVVLSEPLPLLRTAVACAVFSILGGLAPLRLIRNLEPAKVFAS